MIVPLDSDMRDYMKARKADRPSLATKRPLTARKNEVLAHLLRGASEPTVARTMRLSINTVHSHVKAIYAHFGVHSRAQLLLRFIKIGTKRRVIEIGKRSNPLRSGKRPSEALHAGTSR
jgi:DNA-binding NarL/FixJ family response regulator